MNDWFSVLFHYHFYINNPSLSHLIFQSLLKRVFYFNTYISQQSHVIRWSGLAPIKQFVLSKNKPDSEITKFLCFFFINSKNSFVTLISMVPSYFGAGISGLVKEKS